MTYRINGETVTKEQWDASPKVGITPGLPSMIESFQPFRSPIDNKIISSKSQLRAHEREHGVIQVGNAYVGDLKRMHEEAREKKHETEVQQDYQVKWT